MKKRINGFTLVELIVVIAIIGVLAAILVPAMMGWITKANLSTANAGAKQIYQNGQAIYQELEGKGAGYEYGGPNCEISGRIWMGYSDKISDDGTTFQQEMIRKFSDSKSAYWGIQLETPPLASGSPNPKVLVGTARAAVYSKGGKGSTSYIGTYPVIEDNAKNKWSDANDAFTAAMDAADAIFKEGINESP